MASPRPGTSGNSSRPHAYKSPAVKTASLHGHHVSVSSQPSSTPLGGTAVHDDLLALNSPATALMNSLGQTGLTPLGSAADGLGITTSVPGGPVRTAAAAPINPEIERLQRLHMVLDILKGRIGGHGITREGVERIAQMQGFTTLWDDDNLTIAGNCVDLEVNFTAGGGDDIRDVSLKLNILDTAADSEEPQFQEQGTLVIKHNLQSMAVLNRVVHWQSLDAFAANLKYLGQLDRIESGSPCFHAVEDLYSAFRQIWDAEKDRLKGRSAWQHLRQSAVGRPVMDRKPKLGLALDYWASRNDQGSQADTRKNDVVGGSTDLYTAQISCEAGLPSTATNKNWVSDRVLIEGSDSMLDDDAATLQPDWWEPDPEALLPKSLTHGATLEKPTDMSPNILDLHFYCNLLPEVHLPLNVAANLNVEIAMVGIDQDATLTYQAALHKLYATGDLQSDDNVTAERWLRTLPISGDSNAERLRKHSYALHSTQNAPALWCHPLKHLNFNHPRQLAAALPVLRQYVVLWRMLRSLVAYGGTREVKTSIPATSRTQKSNVSARPLKRTNKASPFTTLQDLLKLSGALSTDEPLPVDLTLDVVSDPAKARLDIYIPLVGPLSTQQKSPFVFLGLSVCHNGLVELRDLQGLPLSTDEASSTRLKVVRILEATEDIGMTVEWLLQQASLRA